MRILTEKREIADYTRGHILHLALGYFDGVHVGHQAIFRLASRLAEEKGGEPGILLLEPHPQSVLNKHRSVRQLNTLDEKLTLIRTFGDYTVFLLPFESVLAALSPDDFARDYLAGLFRVKTAVCGYNYHFGAAGAGDCSLLGQLGETYGFACSIAPQVTFGGITVSSTLVRSLLAKGRMYEAYSCLGHAHIFCGEVTSGYGIGATMGFPTANLSMAPDRAWPAFGVYGAFVRDENGRIYRAAINAGKRPTFGGINPQPSFEAFLLDFRSDLYKQKLQVALTERLRPEIAFRDKDSLQEQIVQDIRSVESALEEWEKHLWSKGKALESIFTCFINDFPLR